jgi:hypothetical protein
MIEINEITICLHCGSRPDIVENQMKSLISLNQSLKVFWNNRIDRYPFTYSSYSQLINHSIVTSPTEFVILINDRSFPNVEQVLKILNLLENGFSWVTFKGAGFMGFSKQLIRRIGWWDERFILGGWEDRDWVFRLKEANLAIYEANESDYDYSWKSPLNGPPGVKESSVHWEAKWDLRNESKIYRRLKEDSYPHWDLFNWKSSIFIEKSWLDWKYSVLAKGGKGPHDGDFSSEYLLNRIILDYVPFFKRIFNRI